ncbi:MAG: hypothetical protein HFF36_05535 [Coprobacillus sp.]|nr:hypothetical protein [Coprobacillus sp.]
MKRIICILCFLLIICGCQNKIDNFDSSKSYTIDNQIKLEVIKQEAIQIIEPSNKNMITSGIQAKNDNLFIDVLFKVTNISQEQFKLQQIFSGRYEVNQVSYDLNMIMETKSYTGLTSTDTIKKDEERYVHLYCEIPKDEMKKEIVLHFQVIKQMDYKYTFKIDEETKIDDNQQSIGDTLSLQQSQITLTKLGQSKKIEPSQKGFFYSYIPVDHQDETFIYLQLDIHNTSNQKIIPKNYIYCEYHLDNTKTSSQIILESENHKSLEKSGNIEPLQTRTIYMVVPIKDTLLNKQGYMQLFIEGKTFQITL